MNHRNDRPLRVEDFVAGPASSSSPSFLRRSRAAHRRRLVENIRIFARTLGLDLGALADRFAGLDLERGWRPELYWHTHRLCLALETRDVTGAADILVQLQELPRERVYWDTLRVRSLFDEAWDRRWATRARLAAEHRGIKMSLRPLDQAELERHRDTLMRVRARFAAVDPELFAEHEQYCSELTLFAGNFGTAQNVATAFGLIAFGFGPAEEALDGVLLGQLAHEAGHMRLCSMMDAETLFIDDGQPRYRLSARPDLRPMEAVFHAAFVYARTVRVLERAVDLYPSNASFQRHLQETIPAFRRAYTFVLEEAELTPQGRHLVEDMPRIFEARWDGRGGSCHA